MSEKLEAGVEALKAGQRARAQELLIEVVEQDQENVAAWLWLSSAMDDPEERQICLENVLALDPDNELAQQGLALLAEQQAAAPPRPVPEPEPEAPPLQPEPEAHPPPAPSPQPEETRLSSFQVQPLEDEAETEDFTQQTVDEFDDEYRCVYCLAPTKPDDKRCPNCRKKLWIELRKEKRSTILWIATGIQVVNTFILGAVLYFVAVSMNALAQMDPEMDAATLRLALYGCSTPLFIYQVVVVVGLIMRWKPVYYLYLISAGFTLLSAIVAFFTGAGICGGILNFGLAMVMVWLVFQMESDFFGEKRRIVLRRDKDAKGMASLMESGHRYGRQNIWGLAALHFRQAAWQASRDIGPHLALAVAYINLKRFDLAEKALNNARSIDPNDIKVESLTEELERVRKLNEEKTEKSKPTPEPEPKPKPKSKYRRLNKKE